MNRQNEDLETALKKFAMWAFQRSFEGYDIEAFDLQDKGLALGLLVTEPYDPEKHGESEFDAMPGDDFYVPRPELREYKP